MSPVEPRVRALSERVILVEFGDPAAMDAATRARVRAGVLALTREVIRGTTDVVPAYNTIAVHLDAASLGAFPAPYLEHVLREVRARVSDMPETPPAPGRLVEIPVVYGGADGPDLDEVAAHTGLTATQVVALHAGAVYEVAMIGFSPGFPYLAGMPEQLTTPRRTTPRTHVPAGSVAIGGRQTGIYPQASPGGWRLIGRTTRVLFAPGEDPPALLAPGDRVRFLPVD